jgi:hypothetical protein
MVPVRDLARDVGPLLGPARGRISCVGVAGEIGGAVRSALLSEGASRICAAGEMQTPPLDWPNGNHDLLRDLLGASDTGGGGATG